MPATVYVSGSARTGLRAVIVIAAIVVLLVPIAFSVAYGASRLGFTRVEASEPLPAEVRDIRVDLDTGASLEITTGDTTTPEVTLSGTGPRDDVPQLRVDSTGGRSVVTVDDQQRFENARIDVTIPEATSKDTNLEVSGGFGGVDATGEFKDFTADTSGGSIALSGTFDQVKTMTEWGHTSLRGTYGVIEATTEVGTVDGNSLSVSDRIDATTSAGAVDLEFSNDIVPSSGITVTTEDGSIDLGLPRLDIVKDHMVAEAARPDDAADGDEDGEDSGGHASGGDAGEIKDLFYRITASSSQGTVDLAKDLEKYDAGKDAKEAEGKTLIPVSASSDNGSITIAQR